LSVAIAVGCERAAAPVAKPVAVVEPPVIAEPPLVEEKPEPPHEENPSAAEIDIEPPKPDSKEPAERFIVLTPGGPVIVDARITLEGRRVESTTDKKTGRAVRPIALRTRRAYSPDPRVTSRVWPLVDADADGRLAADELAALADRLWLLDANDDRVLAPAELASLREQLTGRPAPGTAIGRGMTSRLAALYLEPKTDFERVDYVLQDMYAPLQDIGPTSFAALPKLFAQLNGNDDESLDRDELAKLLSVVPHVELAVEFQKSPAEGKLAATVAVRGQAPEIVVTPQESADRVVLALGATRLVVSATEVPPPPAPPAAPAAARKDEETAPTPPIRLMVHDQGDALFAELDADSSGQLSEREVATAAARLRGRDDDGDGSLAGSELPYAMIVAFLHGEAENNRSFYAPAPAAPPQPKAQPPAWFSDADLNHDGDVSRREFLGAAEQFATLDGDGDGYVDVVEAQRVAERSP
jgi:hypothetical protein